MDDQMDSATTAYVPSRSDVRALVDLEQHVRKILRVKIDDIRVKSDRRPVDETAVTQLAESMRTLGLQMPIAVRAREIELAADRKVTEYTLVAGMHRVEAAKQLGWPEIDAVVVDGDDDDARRWELAENLHRAELTVMQRAVYTDEWVRLTEKDLSGQGVRKMRGRPESGAALAGRMLPVPGSTDEARRKTVSRFQQIATISKDAQKAAEAHGLDDSQSALLTVSKEPTKEAQVRKVAELAAQKKVKRPKTKWNAQGEVAIVPSNRKTDEQQCELANRFDDLGRDIAADDLIVLPGSKSAAARQSEYGFIRIPNSHPNRDVLKKDLDALAKKYNTELLFKVLPEQDGRQIAVANDNENAEGGHEQ